jgi:DNA polymerase I-like protein with 3'-5' exonuclease and polymerase domains
MIVNVDAKSLEWCTYLFLSQDKVGIEEWAAVVADPSKNDIHSANQAAFKLPSRLVAKVFLFRWIYRGSAFAYSKDPDFMPVSKKIEFWQNVIDAYYTKYPEIYRTHMRYIKQATTTGRIISPFGREYTFTQHKKWNGDMAWSENDITNWPNQGCGADVMAVARIFARQRMKKAKLESKLISTVHDSIVADCPDKEVEQVAEIFNGVFVDLPTLITASYGVEWNIPMVGEVSVGPNMYDLKELDFSK